MDALYLPEWAAFLRYSDLPGERPALVYLPGLGLAVAGTFDRCIVEPALRRHRQVLLDVLGAGLSDAPEAFSYTLEAHATTVAAVLDHLDLQGSTLIGYSFGGSVAITVAATRPDLVGRLVVAEPNLDPGGGFLSRRIADQGEEAFRRAGHAALVSDSLARASGGNRSWAVTSGMLRVAAPHALHRSAVGLVAGTQPTMRERLLGLPIPRALLRGEASGSDHGERELGARGVTLHTVPGAGHGMPWENPDGFMSAVRTGVDGSPSR